MISPDRIEQAAISIALKNEALKKIRSFEEAMIAEEPSLLAGEMNIGSPTSTLEDHKNIFYYLSDILAEVAGPFKKIRDLWAPESRIVIGDRYSFSFRYGSQKPNSWQRCMMFISHTDDRAYDRVILAQASAEGRLEGFFRKIWSVEYSISVGQVPRYLDEQYGFSFDALEKRSGEASTDFEFVTTSKDIMLARGIVVPRIYTDTYIVPARLGILRVPWGLKLKPDNIDNVEYNLAKLMAGSQAFRNQVGKGN